MPIDLNGNTITSASIGRYGESLRHIVTDGLIVHLDALNKNSYPGSGTTWTDLSGKGNSFTMVGSLSYANGIFTSTASTSNYFILNPFYHPTNTVTVEFWCAPNNGSGADALWGYATTTSDNNNLLYNQASLAMYAPGGAYDTLVNIATGTWRQVVRTSNRTTGREELFVDGVFQAAGTVSAGQNFDATGSLVLGQEQDSVGGGFDPNQAFEGQYAIFRMYNRVLNAQEIRQNYFSSRIRFL